MFEDIRPYDDFQTAAAMKRISTADEVNAISEFLYPGQNPDVLRSVLSSIDSVDSFQELVMYGAINSIIQKTTLGLTFDGLEYFKKSDGSFNNYLLLSNHRDIVLDPAFIQFLLKDNELPLTEIAVGDNLISSPFIEDIMRSNRMIKVKRLGSVRELYDSSKELSEYLRVRLNEGSSVWIAHRNGRTKDGNDVTSQGILKMFNMSGTSDFAENFKELKIMPVSISYEIEPCGIEKALEIFLKSREGKYNKSEHEDFTSILSGILQQKGHVHISFCEPLTEAEISDAASFGKNDNLRRLCEIIDNKIIAGYRIWNNNIIASSDTVPDYIDKSEIVRFNLMINSQLEKVDKILVKNGHSMPDNSSINDIYSVLKGIYAAPYIRKCALFPSDKPKNEK